MAVVNLDPNEWGQVMAILSTAPWRDANPLLMKIGEQLRTQPPPGPPPGLYPAQSGKLGDGADREADDERTH